MNFNVAQYWTALALKAGDLRKWYDLHPQEQQMMIQSINLMLGVLGNNPNNPQNQP